jgi:hypothetical protein
MSQHPVNATFENIESAHTYIGLLRDAVDESRELIRQEIASASSELAKSRHLDALRLVDYKLQSLREHLIASRRLLGDLRTLRRYLLDERGSERAMTESSPESLERTL